MKKIAFLMISVIISAVALFAAPSANASTTVHHPATTSLLSMIPDVMIVEQTATLQNGQTVTIFYKKSGDSCEVFSESDLKGYGINDLVSLQATSFRIVSQPKGKLLYKTTVAKARKIIKSLVNTYL
ncbi:MAG: hypothetical protein K2G90_03960 [Muribaculaceae bacterium]|nr:hypothetical protein [Muribaculaceae bacterium]